MSFDYIAAAKKLAVGKTHFYLNKTTGKIVELYRYADEDIVPSPRAKDYPYTRVIEFGDNSHYIESYTNLTCIADYYKQAQTDDVLCVITPDGTDITDDVYRYTSQRDFAADLPADTPAQARIKAEQQQVAQMYLDRLVEYGSSILTSNKSFAMGFAECDPEFADKHGLKAMCKRAVARIHAYHSGEAYAIVVCDATPKMPVVQSEDYIYGEDDLKHPAIQRLFDATEVDLGEYGNSSDMLKAHTELFLERPPTPTLARPHLYEDER